MAYCTLGDLTTRYSADELAHYCDYDADGAPDAATIAAAISDADSHLDSYLQTQYVVPVVPVPDVLRKRSTTLAMYFLQLRRESVTEDMQREYDHIQQWLKDIVAGKAELGITPKPTESPGAGGVRMTSEPRIYGRGKDL